MDSVFIVSFRVTKESQNKVKEKTIVCEYDLSLIRSVDQCSKLLGALDVDELKCKSCGLLEESETALYIHTWECSKQNKIFKCSLCGKEFISKNTLKKHLRNKHMKKELSCHLCKRTFDTEYARKKHRKTCSWKFESTLVNTQYKCDLCGHMDTSMNDFLNHTRNCEGQYYDCDICEERFTKKQAIREHMYSHTKEKPYSCDVCQKSFLLKRRLHLHIRRVHILKLGTTSKQTYTCITCHKQYRCKQSLRTHVLSHLDMDTVTPYICQLCGKQYSSRGNMNRHIAVRHERKYSDKIKQTVQCEVCGKSYSQTRHLRRHFRINHGDGKLKCPICGKRLSEKKGYDIHMNTHTGIKPWCCEICGRGFSTKDYLKVHVRIHTGDMPYKCDFCPKSYKQKSTLIAHYRLFHPGVESSQSHLVPLQLK